ncbi:MAG: T9SS type A sorting domain-containing protein [Flavobacteriaceae bacterium]|uniref:T9SS type A sorting domain-containing protein n=1 Tax=Mariniflexile sp. TaxID=1979402 RepID=UPI003C953D4B
MKKTLLFIFALILTIGQSFAQATLPLYEDFNYTVGNPLIGQTYPGPGGGNWINGGTSAIDEVIVLSTFTAPSGLPTPTGNAVYIIGGLSDPQIKFTSQVSGTTVYYSCLVQIDEYSPSATAPNTTDGKQILSLTNSTNNYAGSVCVRASGAGYNLGINLADVSGETNWSPTVFPFGSEHLVVMKYIMPTDNTQDNTGTFWIDPPVTNTEPSSVTAPAEMINSIPSIRKRSDLNSFFIRQDSNNNTPGVTIDELRIATTWWQVLGQADPSLGLSKNQIEGLKVYPNPAKDYIAIESNKVRISSVAMYNVLGAKVISEKALVNNRLNIASLAKGIYVLKINAESGSATKKIVIE